VKRTTDDAFISFPTSQDPGAGHCSTTGEPSYTTPISISHFLRLIQHSTTTSSSSAPQGTNARFHRNPIDSIVILSCHGHDWQSIQWIEHRRLPPIWHGSNTLSTHRMDALMYFNRENGFLEAIIRGFRSGIITQSQYMNMTQCENLEDLKLQLASTDYGNFLSNEPSPLTSTVIADRALDHLVGEFDYLRVNSNEPLTRFLDYITYGYMIDNVVLLITGTLHERDTHELLERTHPLGWFDTMPALCVATNVQELYSSVLVETPIGASF
jgi:hypothetical protein